MFLIITTNLKVTIIRQFLPKQFMQDNFYKPLNHITFTLLLGI